MHRFGEILTPQIPDRTVFHADSASREDEIKNFIEKSEAVTVFYGKGESRWEALANSVRIPSSIFIDSAQNKSLITVKNIEERDAVFFDSDGTPELRAGGSRGKAKADTFMGAAMLQRKIDLETDKEKVVGSVCIFENAKKCWRAEYDLRNHKGRAREVVIQKGGVLPSEAEKDTDVARKGESKQLQELKAEYSKANSAEVLKKWAFPLKPRT